VYMQGRRRRKAECTPEEWEVIRAKRREEMRRYRERHPAAKTTKKLVEGMTGVHVHTHSEPRRT